MHSNVTSKIVVGFTLRGPPCIYVVSSFVYILVRPILPSHVRTSPVNTEVLHLAADTAVYRLID